MLECLKEIGITKDFKIYNSNIPLFHYSIYHSNHCVLITFFCISIILLSVFSNNTICKANEISKKSITIDNFDNYRVSIFNKWRIRNHTKREALRIYRVIEENKNKYFDFAPHPGWQGHIEIS